MPNPTRISSHHVDNAMAARRESEVQLHDLIRYQDQNQKLTIAAKAELDITSRRRKEHMARVQAEEQMQKMIAESEYAARQQERMASQNNMLATELERRKTERERKEREIQRICEESEELKELERRLKVAYMNKERAGQHEEKQIIERMQREAEQAIEDQMELDRQQMILAELEKEKARRVVGLVQKAELQQQIIDRDILNVQAKEEAVRDKKLVEEIVAKIEAEDQREIEIRERRKEETRKIIKEYEVQRRVELEQKKRDEEAAEAEIRKHMESMAQREESIQKARAEKEEAQGKMFAKIVEENEKNRAEEEELQMLRDMLWSEELEAARRREEAERKERLEAQKAEMALANEQMLAAKKKQEAVDAAEEGKLVQLMLEKFAQDAEEDRLAEVKRIERREKYKSEIETQKNERLQMFEREKASELSEVETKRVDEEYRLQVVAEARRRLLEQHAPQLDGFLPKGAVSNTDELRIVKRAAEMG